MKNNCWRPSHPAPLAHFLLPYISHVYGIVQAMMVADNACGPAALAIEAFIRSATVLPRRPAVLILEATPDNSYCPPEKFARIVKHNFK